MDWIRTNRVALSFPERQEELASFDLVILSDVGSNTLLFHPQMLARSQPHPTGCACCAISSTRAGACS